MKKVIVLEAQTDVPNRELEKVNVYSFLEEFGVYVTQASVMQIQEENDPVRDSVEGRSITEEEMGGATGG